MIEKKTPLTKMAQTLGFTEGTIINHIEQLIAANEVLDIEYLRPTNTVFKSIQEAFEKQETDRLSPIFEYFEGKYSYDQIRLVKLFITLEK